MFAGAFLHYYLQEKSFEEAGQFANHATAQCIQHFGPRLAKEQYQALTQTLVN